MRRAIPQLTKGSLRKATGPRLSPRTAALVPVIRSTERRSIKAVTGALSIYAMICAWLIAGTFFAFSDFVMAGLARIEPASGIAAMQAMNITVEQNVFFLVANGMIPLSVFFVALGVFFRGPRVPALGGLLFILGAAVPTLMGNVPLNLALADMPADAPATQQFWASFSGEWLVFNHIRLFACILAALCFSHAAFTSFENWRLKK